MRRSLLNAAIAPRRTLAGARCRSLPLVRPPRPSSQTDTRIAFMAHVEAGRAGLRDVCRRALRAAASRQAPFCAVRFWSRCGARYVTAAVPCRVLLMNRRFRSLLPSLLRGTVSADSAVLPAAFGIKPGCEAADAAFRSLANLHYPPVSMPDHARLACFAARIRAFFVAVAAPGALRSLPGRSLPGCGFAAVSGSRGPLPVAFSPTHSKCVAAWSGLARILNPCRIEVLQDCRIAALQVCKPAGLQDS